jgi:putative Mg2+ transporter-C (MgtC) family protein
MQSVNYFFDQPFVVVLLRLMLAVVLAGFLGANREKADKPAGLRTHMLVALGSASFTTLGFGIGSDSQEPLVHPDPSRVIQGVIGGLGFLGAGSIIKDAKENGEGNVYGLTTAASIWVAGAVGVAAGMGAYAAATATALIGLVVLALARRQWF